MTLIWLYLSLFSSAHAVTSAQWTEVESWIRDGKTSEVVHFLETQSLQSGADHYNAGTLALRIAYPGLAFAHLEEAHRLLPHDTDVSDHYQAAAQAIESSLGREQIYGALSWIDLFADSLLFTIGVLGLCMGALGWTIFALIKGRALWPPASLALLAILFLGTQRYAMWRPIWISKVSQGVKSGPTQNFMELFRIEAGVFVKELDTSGEWLQVKTATGIGWIPAQSAIRLSSSDS